MENKDLEIIRFSKKAASYRKALESAPNSRILEIAPILSVLEGYIKDNEIEKSKLKIVDLMSGNGFLSHQLKKAGFINLHAIEACNEMSSNSDDYNGILLHPISKIKEINRILKDIQPNVVVSLASFHHLIVRDQENIINTNMSLKLQSDVISICIKHLEKNGILILVDIFDDSLVYDADYYPDNRLWSKKSLTKTINRSFIHKDIKFLINESKGLDTYSDTLKNTMPNFENTLNPTINWFRNVVNKKTTLGHDDMAISLNLIEFLNTKYKITIDTFYCPWVFDNLSQLENFIWYKFGFVNNETDLTSVNEIIDLAKNEVGINQYQDKEFYFGWSLCMLTVQDKNSTYKTFSKRITAIQTIALIIILVLYGIPKKLMFYSNDTIDKLIFILVGSLLKTFFDFLSDKFSKNK